MADNLALWRLVERTDPAQTKPITGKPYKGTSPKPYWLVQKATETFGPCGVGWGFEILSQQFVPGAPGDILHVAHICVWYEYDGKRGSVEHVGQTMLAGKNKNGPYTDEDAPKKSVTDALVKALSMIGFAGDIFMGRYDDSKYVAEVRHEFEEERREASAQTSSSGPTATLSGYMGIALSRIRTFASRDAINDWYMLEKENRDKYLDADQKAALLAEVRKYGETLGQSGRTAA